MSDAAVCQCASFRNATEVSMKMISAFVCCIVMTSGIPTPPKWPDHTPCAPSMLPKLCQQLIRLMTRTHATWTLHHGDADLHLPCRTLCALPTRFPRHQLATVSPEQVLNIVTSRRDSTAQRSQLMPTMHENKPPSSPSPDPHMPYAYERRRSYVDQLLRAAIQGLAPESAADEGAWPFVS